MRIQAKEKKASETPLAVLDQRWDLFMPGVTGVPETDDLHHTRAALQQAETVIRAQEERIRILESIALTDELTGLFNRRGFAQALDRELAFARRDANYKGMLVMIDLDGFKTVNDKWGHNAGDLYLCTVAEALLKGVRSTDIVARLGGDEFAILFPSLDETIGKRRLAKLEQSFCRRVAALQENVPLRASFGFAAYAGNDRAEAVMHAADVRLYAHKTRSKKAIEILS